MVNMTNTSFDPNRDWSALVKRIVKPFQHNCRNLATSTRDKKRVVRIPRSRQNGHKIVRTLRGRLMRVRGAFAPRLRDAELSHELGRHLQAY